MAFLLRQIVAGPRARHPEANLDLCYVTDNIIATSGPSSTYPQRAYRNPTDELVRFLDYKHGSKWSIWEFRAEGTGYPDEEVYNRIRHYPWPDHHPPPFALIPNIMASMRDWLKGPEAEKDRVAVVHCKAGKGRSGTVACSYLISQEGWSREDALARFTARRMRSGFGEGISIPSQQRWIKYVHWWTKHDKVYVERQMEILEVHVWGLRDGVKVAVEGFVDAGRVIKTFHTFSNDERTLMMDEAPLHHLLSTTSETDLGKPPHQNGRLLEKSSTPSTTSTQPKANAALFRPSTPIILPTSDINIDFERRNKAAYGFTMVTSVAHVWFNAFFESQFSSTDPTLANLDDTPVSTDPTPNSGVFSIPWEAMDGIRGSAKKGTRAFDRLSVVWCAVADPAEANPLATIITEPEPGESVPESGAAAWRKADDGNPSNGEKGLGLRTESPARGLSKANSVKSGITTPSNEYASDGDGGGGHEGVKARGPDGEEHISVSSQQQQQQQAQLDPPSSLSTSTSAPHTDASASVSAPPFTQSASDMSKGGDSKLESDVRTPVLGTVTDEGLRARNMNDETIKGKTEQLPEAVEHLPGQVVWEGTSS